MNKFFLLLLAMLLFSQAGFAQGEGESSHSASCPKSAANTYVSENLYQTGFLGSVVITLLSGNTKEAIDHLGKEIATNILVLNGIRKVNSCGASEKYVSKIYSTFRVIAAINYKSPIPGVNDNHKVMHILEKAIKANPSQYKTLIERSRYWGKGIN